MGKGLVAAVVLGVAALGSGAAWAQKKPCEELKSEIDGKLKAKGVRQYTLDIVDAAQAKDGVVGSCDGGTKKIVYKRA